MQNEPCHLVVLEGRQSGRRIAVPADGLSVGRSSKNDLMLDEPLLSRYHSRFSFGEDGALRVTDLGSANGTQVNGRKVTEAPLRTGNLVTLGDVVLKVEADRLAPSGPEGATETDAAEEKGTGRLWRTSALVVTAFLAGAAAGWFAKPGPRNVNRPPSAQTTAPKSAPPRTPRPSPPAIKPLVLEETSADTAAAPDLSPEEPAPPDLDAQEPAPVRAAADKAAQPTGRLILTTRPAGIDVAVDDENRGTTVADVEDTSAPSQALEIAPLPLGEHTVTLSRRGYAPEQFRIFIQPREALILHKDLKAAFVPDYEVQTSNEVYRGVLTGKMSDGAIRLQVRPGIYRTVPVQDILDHGPLSGSGDRE